MVLWVIIRISRYNTDYHKNICSFQRTYLKLLMHLVRNRKWQLIVIESTTLAFIFDATNSYLIKRIKGIQFIFWLLYPIDVTFINISIMDIFLMHYWGPTYPEKSFYTIVWVVDVIGYLFVRKQMKIKGPKLKVDGRQIKQLFIHYKWMLEIMEK